MRLLVLNTIFIAFSLPMFAFANGEDIDWQTNLEAAMEEARQREAIVMVDLYTEWCGWCGELDRRVYTDRWVISFSRWLVNVKLDAEDGGEGEALARRHGVSGFPTILFLRHDGREVDRIIGFLPAQQFVDEMRHIHSGRDTFLSLQLEQEGGTIGDAGRLLLARKYFDRGMFLAAEELLERYLESVGDDGSDDSQYAMLMMAHIMVLHRDLEAAEALLLGLHERYPNSEYAARVLFFLVVTRRGNGDVEDAGAYLAELERRFPLEQRLIALARRFLASNL